MKVALYRRVSTKDQDLTIQKEKQIEYVESKNLSVFKVYEEKISGKNADRPELQRMLKDAQDKKFISVVVVKVDRLGRSLSDVLIILETLEKNDINIISISEGLDTSTKMGRMILQILALVADWEREWINERVQAGREYAKLHGTKSGKPMHRPRKELPMTDKEIVELYKKDVSMSKLSRMNDCTISVIRTRLDEAGVKIRSWKAND